MSSDMYKNIIQEITNELGLDVETAAEFLNDYLAQLPDEIANLKNSIENNDFVTGAALAHSLKGTSGNLRIMPLHKIMAELEQALKSPEAGMVAQLMLDLALIVTDLKAD